MSNQALQRRALLRTVLIAAVLALATSYGVFRLRHYATPERSKSEALAIAVARAFNTAAELRESARLTAGPTTVQKQGEAERALNEAEKAVQALGVRAGLLAQSVQNGATASINEQLRAYKVEVHRVPKVGAFGDPFVAVEPRGEVEVRGLARPIKVALTMPLSRPMLEVGDDDALAEQGMISLRAISRAMIDKQLLAWLNEFERCPTELRGEEALTLGQALDRAYLKEAERLMPADTRAKERLMPLCRRQRLVRLADIGMRKASGRFPFFPLPLLSDEDEAWVKRYLDPAKTPGIVSATRAHFSGVLHAESDLKQEADTLRLALAKGLASYVHEAALSVAVLSLGKQAPTDVVGAQPWPKWFASLGAEPKLIEAKTCAVLATLRDASVGKRASLRLIDRFTVAAWPDPEWRAAFLAALYLRTSLVPPAEGMASLTQMQLLLEALDQGAKEAPSPCVVSQPSQTLLDPAFEHALLESLVP